LFAPAWSSLSRASRPRSSYARFEAAQPNETWQSDVTHWRLGDRTDAESFCWLDDHSRFLVSATALHAASSEDVIATFIAAVDEHGVPASTLTDNARIYTARFGGGRNAFEYLLPILGVQQKNGSPGHPQTQGKIERFHQTLKRWLAAQPPPRTVVELQRQLDVFREHYNQHRPHRALGRATPGQAYRATPKALPAAQQHPGFYRLRYDRLDPKGRMTLRRAGKMHHLGPRRRPRPQTRHRPRRRHPRHRLRPRHRRSPLHPPHPATQDLLAQPRQRARPLAEPHTTRHMTRDT